MTRLPFGTVGSRDDMAIPLNYIARNLSRAG